MEEKEITHEEKINVEIAAETNRSLIRLQNLMLWLAENDAPLLPQKNAKQ
ncbi:hypothetical protein K9N08_00060 [Candidatus Gracilibacteria bacterium]|nr:hypothetical protein [Candidatus Gracilibacteria bacterium]MCF7855944.1 hypothetical protein [Candidatus Gracilibacteria bacterium]MCF7896363.1 hypothetical protein [Candidatus Gracilibacteria bacterium]